MSHGVTPNVILRFGEFQLSQDIGSTCVHSSRQGSHHDLVNLKLNASTLKFTLQLQTSDWKFKVQASQCHFKHHATLHFNFELCTLYLNIKLPTSRWKLTLQITLLHITQAKTEVETEFSNMTFRQYIRVSSTLRTQQ